MNSEKQYIELFSLCRQMLEQGSEELINAPREEALVCLQTNGLPTLKNERYKYTDIQAAFAPDYGLNLNRLPIKFDPYKAYKCSVPGIESKCFYLVNDRVEAKEKLIDDANLYVGSLDDFARKYPEKFSTYYNKVSKNYNKVGKGYKKESKDGVVALNTLLSQDGVVIWVAEGYKVPFPIQFVNLTVGNVPMMTNRRQLVILEKNAEASVLFCDHSATQNAHLTTEVAEIFLEEGSSLQYYSLEETADNNSLFNNTNVVQQTSSRMEYASVTLHNGLTRRTVDINLNGKNATTQASGLVLGGEKQHVDNNLLVAHRAESCSSDVLYKYVLDGESRGAFAGMVLVEQGAQKTESQETNANLCVSPSAHMYTQPMLEIYADDVKCNHGSTVGQLDENALFYMAQRGVAPDEGKRLLQQAFAWEVIDRIQLPALKERLARMVEERIRRGAGACGDCSLCSTK